MKNKGKIILVASLAVILGGSIFAWSYVQAVSSLNGIINGVGANIYNLNGLSIGTTTQAATGTVILGSGGLIFPNGTAQTTPYLGSSQTVTAGNIAGPGVFGYPAGSNAYAFPAALGVGTNSTAGLPQTLSVYGGGYFSGSVGIGTTAPAYTLQVQGSLHTGAASSGNLGGASYDLAGYSVGSQTLYSYGAMCAGNSSGQCNSSGGVVISAGGSPNTSATVGLSSGISFFNGGNVGIGTTAPGYKLDVAGQINSSNKITASESSGTVNGGFSFTQDGAQDTGMFSPSDGVIDFYNNAAKTVDINASGQATFYQNATFNGTIYAAGVNNFWNNTTLDLAGGTGLLYVHNLADSGGITDITLASGAVTFPNTVNIGNSNSQLNQTGALNVYNSGGTLLATGYSVQNPVVNSGFYAVNTVPYGINYVAGDNSMPYGFAIQDTRTGEHAGFLAVPGSSNGGNTNMVFYVGNDGSNTFQFVPFTWDGTNNHLGSPVMTIGAQTGNVTITGTVTAGGFSGPLTGTESAANVSGNATFGNNTGLGTYTFTTASTGYPLQVSGYSGAAVGVEIGIQGSAPGYGSLLVLNNGTAEITLDGSAGNITANGALAAATVNTGQGANELYAMNQNVRTTDSPIFAAGTFTGTVTAAGTITSNSYIYGTGISLHAAANQVSIFMNKDSNSYNSGLRFQTAGADDWLVGEHTSQNFSLYSYPAGTDVFVVTTAGNASVTGSLSVGGSVSGTNALTVNGGTNRSYIAGYLMIGTTTPQYSLTVDSINGIYVHASGSGGSGIVAYGSGSATTVIAGSGSNGAIGIYGYSNNAGVYGQGYSGGVDFKGYNGEYTNGGVWTNGSSRTLKTDFTSLNKEDILGKIMQLPITKWVYKSDPNQWHIGPMAEDFYPLFGTSNSVSIDTESPASVALIGVQALDEKISTQQVEIDNLKSLVCEDHPSSSYCQ